MMTSSNNYSTTSNQVLSQDQILAEMNYAVSDLKPLLPITPEQRKLLLLKFDWDIESLRNSFKEYADTNSFLLENGIRPNNTVSVTNESECVICCATKRLQGLRCQHMACMNCWRKYLDSKIRNNRCVLLRCIEFGCNMLISNEMLGKFLSSSKLKHIHQSLIKDSFINSDSSLAWCNKKCGRAVRRSNYDTVTCSCGSTFCFLCKLDAHQPATCVQFRLWEKQRTDFGQQTSFWILLNTRECPRCFVPIQKNGGCNRMTCTRCRFEYCWACWRNWKTHFGDCKQSDITRAQSQQYNSKEIYQRDLEFFLDKIARQQNGYYGNDSYDEYLSRAKAQAEECRTLRKALLDHCAGGAKYENLDGRQQSFFYDSIEVWSAIILGFFVIVIVGLGWVFEYFSSMQQQDFSTDQAE